MDIPVFLIYRAFPKENESMALREHAILLLLLFVPQGQKRIAMPLKKDGPIICFDRLYGLLESQIRLFCRTIIGSL